MSNVLKFPQKPPKKKLSADDVESIEFITADGRFLYVDDPQHIVKIMTAIIQHRIPILEG